MAQSLHSPRQVNAMLNIKHILFPIDFSDRCCTAAPFVESIARRYKAKTTMFSVAQPFYLPSMGDPTGGAVFDTEELVRDASDRLAHTLTKEFAGLEVERIVRFGDPAQSIVDFAHAHEVDLIMMPTHGYGPFRSLLLGSVAAKVLHDAHCPVWTAAHVPDKPAREHIACGKILCAVDGSQASIPLMKWAVDFAKDAGAGLRFVHVIPGMEGFPEGHLDREFEEDLRKDALRNIDALQQAVGSEMPICVTAGSVATSVREEAFRHKADLVIIGRGAMQESMGRLRTHAYGIIRQSPCPVLSV